MKFKITIQKPKGPIDGWTGWLTDPRDGSKIKLNDWCGGGVCAFNTKAALVKEATRIARGLI